MVCSSHKPQHRVIPVLTIAEIRAELKDKNLAYVARQIGMNRQQLWQIATGVNANPGILTAEKISDYLESRAKDAEE